MQKPASTALNSERYCSALWSSSISVWPRPSPLVSIGDRTCAMARPRRHRGLESTGTKNTPGTEAPVALLGLVPFSAPPYRRPLYARSTKSSFCDISDDERMTPNSLSRSVPDGNDNLKGPSARAFPEQDHADSADHDQKVENKIAMVHVIQIVCQLLSRVLDGGAVGVVHLRPPGDAGPDV